jgi:hypothetical protein
LVFLFINTQTGIALQHYNASSVIKDAAVINASLSSVTAGSENGYLTFSTINAGSSGERVRIDNIGNVGIATTSPANKLHVEETWTATVATNDIARFARLGNLVAATIGYDDRAALNGIYLGTVTNHPLSFRTKGKVVRRRRLN